MPRYLGIMPILRLGKYQYNLTP